MKKIILLVVIIFTCKIYSQQTDKVLVHQQSDLKIWVYTKSIVKEDEYVTFWSEWEYLTQTMRNETINDRINFIKEYEKDTDIDFVKWSRFKSTKEQTCIDITDKTRNFIQILYYTNTGELLYTSKFEKASWDNVIPESVFEPVYDYVKKYAETKLK